MSAESREEIISETIKKVSASKHICVAVDEQLRYLAINDITCDYLNVKREQMLGAGALQRYPEITASANHRNILKSLSGHFIENQFIESRKGDILLTSYTPVYDKEQVIAVIVEGKLSQ